MKLPLLWDKLQTVIDYFFFGIAIIICFICFILGFSCVGIAINIVAITGWAGLLSWLLLIPLAGCMFGAMYVVFQVARNELL